MILVDSSVWIDYFTGIADTQTDMLGKDIAIKSADNFRMLRERGITIRKTADVIIATFCIERGLPLLFSDKGFKPFVNHFGLTEV